MVFIKKLLSFIFCILFLLLIVGSLISSVKTIPDNAVVYVDDTKRIYYAPPYLQSNTIKLENLRITTVKEAHSKKYNPDYNCRDEGYFTQDGRSLTGYFLEHIGILEKLESRWSENGDWLY